jgi:hypothetical protein
MSSDQITYAFCVNNIKYIIDIIGYDALIKEAQFIHHLGKNDSIPTTIIKNEIVDVPNIVVEPPSETDKSSVKSVTIDNNTPKYVRTPVPNELRCDSILGNGLRCTLKMIHNANNIKYCGRHIPKQSL